MRVEHPNTKVAELLARMVREALQEREYEIDYLGISERNGWHKGQHQLRIDKGHHTAGCFVWPQDEDNARYRVAATVDLLIRTVERSKKYGAEQRREENVAVVPSLLASVDKGRRTGD